MNRYFCLLLCMAAGTAGAAEWVHVEQIDAPCCGSASHTNLHFGATVAADLSPTSPPQIRALYVGAPGYSPTINGTVYPESGIVFVFVPVAGGWQEATYIEPISAQANAHFGAAIAVNNGVLVVGEPDYDNQTHPNAGRITLLFDRNHNVPSSAPAFNGIVDFEGLVDNARLGDSVAVAGDGIGTGGAGNWVTSGAPGGAGAGCAFLNYLGDDQSFFDKGSVCGATSGDVFGASVAVYSFGATNLLMAVGAPGEGGAAGGAHVYFLNGGNLTNLSNLQAQNPGIFDFFGTSIAIDANRLYVGGTGRDKSGVGRTGSVTLFNPGGPNHYTFDTEVFPGSNANAGDLCGASVYPNPLGSQFVVGCPGSNAQFDGEGFARVFEPFVVFGSTVWFDHVLQMGSLPHGADDLGRGVVMVGNRAFAGAPLTDSALGTDNGGVQVFITDTIFVDGFGG
jgi:hypothetical protein